MACGDNHQDIQERSAWPGINMAGAQGKGSYIRPLESGDRVFRVSGLASIAAAGTGTAVTFTWQYPGFVISMLACALGDGSDAGLASLGMQLTVGDANEAIFSDGASGSFVQLMNIHGRSFQPFLLRRWVHQSEIWTVQFNNSHAANAYTPAVAFHFRRKAADFGQSPGAAMAHGNGRGY